MDKFFLDVLKVKPISLAATKIHGLLSTHNYEQAASTLEKTLGKGRYIYVIQKTLRDEIGPLVYSYSIIEMEERCTIVNETALFI